MSCDSYSDPSIFDNDAELMAEGLALFKSLYPNKVRLVDKSRQLLDIFEGDFYQTAIVFETDLEFHQYVVQHNCMVSICAEDRVHFGGPYNKRLQALYARILDPISYFTFSGDLSLMYGDKSDEESVDSEESSEAASENCSLAERNDNSTTSSRKRSRNNVDDSSSIDSSDVSLGESDIPLRRSKRVNK